MRNTVMTALALMGILSSCNSQNNVTVNGETVELEDGIYAKFATNQGDILVEFNTEDAPMTTANFVALAEGNHPEVAEQYQGVNYFDGLIFHRVIPGFMIQGGDPEGSGSGGPGYKFPNETDNDLTHDKGVISMANAGPNTNGSQFFITVANTSQLDGSYSIFGEVVKGQEIADKISKVETNNQDRPLEEVVMEKVEIIRQGKAAEEFDAPSVFATEKEMVKEKVRQKEEAKKKADEERVKAQKEKVDALTADMEATDSGLFYKKENKTDGARPEKGQSVSVHYTGKLPDGEKFDSSHDRGEPISFPLGQGQVIRGWDEGIALLRVGEKARFVIPPHLGYGARGAGPIPPNSWLVFDVELVSIEE